MAIGFASCGTTPARLTLARSAPTQESVAAGSIPIQLVVMDQQRPDFELLGEVGGRAFSATDVSAWVEQAILGLKSPHFVVVPYREGQTEGQILRVGLVKVYVDSIHLTKTAVVVIETELVGANLGKPTKHFYRGQIAAMNWASASDEIAGALRRALARCLAQLKRDLDASIKH